MRQVADFAGDLFLLFPDIVNWGVEISGVRAERFSGFGKVAKTANILQDVIDCFLSYIFPFRNFFLRIASHPHVKNAFVASGCESKVCCNEKGVRSYAYCALVTSENLHRAG
jgi:hypothetical protein